MFDGYPNSTHVGVACTSYLYTLTPEQLAAFDYIEVPFELLHHDPSVINKLSGKPIILHCASLSLAGYTRPETNLVEKIAEYTEISKTPWLGEHLSFILAEKIDDQFCEQYAPGEPYNIGYTVAPVMNSSSISNIVENVNRYSNELNTNIILENPPLYFSTPGSNMDQLDFIRLLCAESSIELLLDLAHFYITARNFKYDPIAALSRFPLERVREIHISGVNLDTELYWDNHAEKAPDIIFDMLEVVLKNSCPSAITLEYNWSANFPWKILEKELNRTKETLYKCHLL